MLTPTHIKTLLLGLLLGGLAILASCDVAPVLGPTPIPAPGGRTPQPLPRRTFPPQPGLPTPSALWTTIRPDLPRPQPVDATFHGCPANGDGGDRDMNILKNRIDEAAWQPATVGAVLDLAWPPSIETQRRVNWGAADRAAIARYEGLPLQLTGYLAGARKEGPESANCHSTDDVDYHVWLVSEPGMDRTRSVVVEITPRVEAFHPGWTEGRLRDLVNRQVGVRISGWLMMDPEHPDQIGKTRGTIWEIHPIMQIEVNQGGTWVPLDQGSTATEAETPLPTPRDEPPTIAEPPDAGVPTATARPGGSSQSSGAVQITTIFANGQKTNEPDEYVEITNTDAAEVVMDGWTLSDLAKHTFTWDNFTLPGNATIRVYTNEVRREWGGFSYGFGSPIWNNKGDAAFLRDGTDAIVATYRYGDQK